MSVVPDNDDMPLSNRFDLNLRKTAVDARKRNELAKKLRIKLMENPDSKINIPGILELGFEAPYSKEEIDDIIETVLSKINGELRIISDADPKESRDTSRKNLLGMTIPDRDEICGKECGSFLDIDCFTNKIIEKCPGSSGFCDFIPFPGCEQYWTYIVIGGVVAVAALFILK